jgi:hypothetical protein
MIWNCFSASGGSDSLSGVTGRHFDAPGEFLNSMIAMTANLAFIPLGTVGPRHPQVRVYACEVPS